MIDLPEGFVAHRGICCPLDRNTLVEVIFADGGRDKYRAGFFSGGYGADDFWTNQCDPEDRIIAYKPHTQGAEHG